MNWTRLQALPIGVDIGVDSVKMLQVEIVGETLSVVAAARHALPEEVVNDPSLRIPAAVDAIQQILRRGAFSGRRIVTAMPRDIVTVKNLRLPPIPPTELQSAVEFEARNVMPFETEKAAVRYISAGEIRQGTDARQEVMVIAARDDETDEFVESLHRSAAILVSLDFEPCAIYRGVERFIRRREDEGEVHVLVDVGLRRSQVVIGKGRDISFYKPIDIGGGTFNRAVATKLGITISEAKALRRRLIESAPALDSNGPRDSQRDPVRQAVFDSVRSTMEELAREISLCLRYHSVTFRGHRPGKVRLVGGEGNDPHLLAVVAAGLSVPVESGQPLLSVDIGRMKPAERRGSMSEWAVAFGLSLKSTSNYFAPKDGKAREPTPSNAEVVDLNSAVHSVGATTAAAPMALSPAASAMPMEAVRA